MLQFITHGTTVSEYINGAKAALDGGCRWIQLRMKQATDDQIIEAAFSIRKLCNQYKATFLINDRNDLVVATKADGVHLGKMDASPSDVRKILGKEYIIGGTANTFEDVTHLINQNVDYIGLGPFRYTTTKKNLSPILGLEGYKNIIERCKQRGYSTPIVAIGGILRKDIQQIMETGVSGIALSGAIINAINPIEETQEVIKLIKK